MVTYPGKAVRVITGVKGELLRAPPILIKEHRSMRREGDGVETAGEE